MLDFQPQKGLKKRWVKSGSKGEIEPHEILLDKLARRKEEELDISEKKLEVPLSKIILRGFVLFCFLIIFVLFAKTFQLQVIEGKEWTQLAQENKFIIKKIQAERGVIYDQNMKQLVYNEPSFDLICEKNNLPQSETERKEAIEEVARILNIRTTELEAKIENGEIISENLEHQALITLETKITELPGFKIEKTSVRNYTEGEAFSHVLGYMAKIKPDELSDFEESYSINDYVGRDGVEKVYEDVLRTDPGELRIERDVLGNVISKEIVGLPESGESLVLWLDADLQKKVEEELEKMVQALGNKKAAAVALDPETGGILSMVSLPGFDNNLFQKGSDPKELAKLFKDSTQPLFNRAIAGTYAVGSTIKPLISSAVLEENIISPQKKIDCEGRIVIPSIYNPEESSIKLDWTTHGWTDMRKAIAESCDVYFYTVGGGFGSQKGLGPTKIKDYLELFGWDSKTGVDLPGESQGSIPDKDWKRKTLNEPWWDGDTYNLAIGQGYLQTTPIEVAASFAAIANGGKLLEPRVVKEVVNDKKEVVEEIQSKVIRENFINPQNLQIVREGLRQAVTGVNSPQASSITLNSLPVSSAAKTGTAELGNDRYNNWVTVFAPYDDPKIVLTIVVENVKGVKAAALPVAKEILNWYFSE
ncbi:MAG: penicillin-binding protein 2 [Candidatus Paceibacterota bacterium]